MFPLFFNSPRLETLAVIFSPPSSYVYVCHQVLSFLSSEISWTWPFPYLCPHSPILGSTHSQLNLRAAGPPAPTQASQIHTTLSHQVDLLKCHFHVLRLKTLQWLCTVFYGKSDFLPGFSSAPFPRITYISAVLHCPSRGPQPFPPLGDYSRSLMHLTIPLSSLCLVWAKPAFSVTSHSGQCSPNITLWITLSLVPKLKR